MVDAGHAVVTLTGTGMSSAAVRVGLAGLGRRGVFHLERIGLRKDLEIAAVYDPDPGRPKDLATTGATIDSRLDSFLERKDIDFIIVAAPIAARAQLAVAALEAGKHVAVVPPACLSTAEALAMVSAARRAGRKLCVLPERRDGQDFFAAAEAVRQGALGAIGSCRLLSWGKAIPETSAVKGSAAIEDDAFTSFAFQYVDQLLQLMTRAPRSVFAKIRRPKSVDGSTIFTLIVGFEGDGEGLIDVNLESDATFHTGWMLAGDAGSYHGQRIYVSDPSGEIVDSPVNAPEGSLLDLYAGLVDPAASNGPLPSALEMALAMQVIDAARRSAAEEERVVLIGSE